MIVKGRVKEIKQKKIYFKKLKCPFEEHTEFRVADHSHVKPRR